MVVLVYHTTPTKNRQSILDNGLQARGKTMGSFKYEPVVFVSTLPNDIATLDFLAQYEDIDIWEFKIEEAELKKDLNSHVENHYFIEHAIKKENLKLKLSL